MQLRDFVELAAKRRKTTSGRGLAEIARAGGHDISHSTVNRIRSGTYTSEPTTEILKAIAYLAKEPDELVFAAGAETHEWAAMESAFFAWHDAQARVLNLTDRYARMRGITVTAASAELNDMAKQLLDFHAGRAGWYPPWDPESEAQRKADGCSDPPEADEPPEVWSRSDELKERPGRIIIEPPEEPGVDRREDGYDSQNFSSG